MELLIKSSAAALTAIVIGLLIKKSNPELSLLLSACTVAVILASVIGLAQGIKDLAEAVHTVSGSKETLVSPVLKCVAIAVITKITTELCRDSSQASLASAVELAGTVCAVCIAMPLIMSMLKMIGAMV